jgi:hypothetical protein
MRPSRLPANTRTLSVRLGPAGHDRLSVDARLLDVRKRGVVEVAGRVNGPGVVHDMRLVLVVATRGLRVLDASLEMASVPFPASAITAGEGCRDNEARATALVGLPLGPGFVTALQRVMGGVRGCFHVFTLMRLVAATTVRATGQPDGLASALARTLTVDALWVGDGLVLHGCLTDVRTTLGEGTARARGLFEAEAVLGGALPDLVLERVEVAHREESAAGGYGWTAAGLEQVGDLAGRSLARGYAMHVGDAVSARGALAPVHDLLLMMQPVAFQAMPARPIGDAAGVPRPRRPVAAQDSCAMWRQDGPLVRAVEEEARGRTD